MIGALTCSRLPERRGRKGTLVMLAVAFVVGSLWCALAPDPVPLSLGPIVLGFAVGGATQTAPMYVAEPSPPRYRGRLVLAFQIAIGVGIVIATALWLYAAFNVAAWLFVYFRMPDLTGASLEEIEGQAGRRPIPTRRLLAPAGDLDHALTGSAPGTAIGLIKYTARPVLRRHEISSRAPSRPRPGIGS